MNCLVGKINMALYDLVTLKQALKQSVNPEPAIHHLVVLRDKIANVKLQVPVLDSAHSLYIDQLVAQYNQIIEQAGQPLDGLQAQIDDIDNQINNITHSLFAGNYELEERYGTVESVRNNRRIFVNEDLEQTIKQRIMLHTNWRYPSLEIGCRDGEWTQYMVAADPLYIMDRHAEFIDSTNNRFLEAYQRRLRKYPLKNHDLSALPQNQMAFVFSWGYFNYVSIDTMKQYLRQIFDLLRPGGIFMFSYNDGDTPAGAGMAENFAQTYMPKSMLVPLCESMGYEISNTNIHSTNIHWIEIKRPGTLETVKAHQVLGEIKSITL